MAKLVWLQAEPHDLKLSTAVIISEARSSTLGRCFGGVYVQPQECGVTLTDSPNLVAALAALLAGLRVEQGRSEEKWIR